ncbi:Predicted transcriptional regulator [Pseudomonas syringae pv. actinidiae]|uniref:Predicted transcriptional regulator n=1 Tax=Pseudomonas syringae pv. actinidiae TaxID=103796 RepID=A0A2V0Q767_PSESF|nr:Predicted transcriptional regulator [Pseudomonas syringae pv. actinidiae]
MAWLSTFKTATGWSIAPSAGMFTMTCRIWIRTPVSVFWIFISRRLEAYLSRIPENKKPGPFNKGRAFYHFAAMTG